VYADFYTHHFWKYNEVSDVGLYAYVFAAFLGFFGFT